MLTPSQFLKRGIPLGRRSISIPSVFLPTAEPTERLQHLRILEVRVAPARIRQYEHAGAVNGHGLRADNILSYWARGRRTVKQREDRAIQSDANERDYFRSVSPDLPVQNLPALDVFSRAQVINSRTRSRDQIGDAEIPFEQAAVIDICDWCRSQFRIAKEFPKTVRISGKMVSGYCRSHARVDADKQHIEARSDMIRQSQLRPV
jgi:hypothetical protein